MKYHSAGRHGACLLFWLCLRWGSVWMDDCGLQMYVQLLLVGWLVNVNEILVGHMTCYTNGKVHVFYCKNGLCFFGEFQFIFSMQRIHTHKTAISTVLGD